MSVGRTGTVWLLLIAMFSAAWGLGQAGSVLEGVVLGGIGLAIARRMIVRRRAAPLRALGYFAGAGITMVALAYVMVDGLAAVTTSIVAFGTTFTLELLAYLRAINERRTIARLNGALKANTSLTRPIAEIETWRTPAVFAACDALLAYRRSDLVLRLLTSTGWANPLVVAAYKVSAHLDLGRTDAARTVVDAMAEPREPIARELIALLEARVALAEDPTRAVEVLVELAVEATAPCHAIRIEVFADARAAAGDRDEARRLLAQLALVDAQRLPILHASSRPTAAIAADLLAGAAPFR
jgi:hypothetical protein